MLGDVKIKLVTEGGAAREYALRPTWRALWNIEGRLGGLSLAGLLVSPVISRQLTHELMASVIAEGIRASEEWQPTPEDVAPMLFASRADMGQVYRAVLDYLDVLNNGGVPEDSPLRDPTIKTTESGETVAHLGGNGSGSPPASCDGPSESSGTAPSPGSSPPSSG